MAHSKTPLIDLNVSLNDGPSKMEILNSREHLEKFGSMQSYGTDTVIIIPLKQARKSGRQPQRLFIREEIALFVQTCDHSCMFTK